MKTIFSFFAVLISGGFAFANSVNYTPGVVDYSPIEVKKPADPVSKPTAVPEAKPATVPQNSCPGGVCPVPQKLVPQGGCSNGSCAVPSGSVITGSLSMQGGCSSGSCGSPQNSSGFRSRNSGRIMGRIFGR
jgi:hypothetical protein